MECIFDSDFVTHTVYSLYWVDKIDKYKKTKKLEWWEQEWERQTLTIFLSVTSPSVVFRNQSIILVTCNIDTTWPENISITRCSWNLHNPRTRSEAARRLVSTSKKINNFIVERIITVIATVLVLWIWNLKLQVSNHFLTFLINLVCSSDIGIFQWFMSYPLQH